MSLRIGREELSEVVSGQIVESKERLTSIGVVFSSAEIKGGELFVALKGESTHGHKFLADAFAKGASLALVEDRSLLDNPDYGSRLVYVPDTLLAFSELAKWWRKILGVPVIAVTGSVGKTTTKEMIAAILLQKSTGIYSLKSHNNHTGVPYTILRAGKEHAWMVLEMGMNHPGELAPLSKIGEPNVAIVTHVAPAHIGHMGSLEAIVDEKLSISKGLVAGGTLIINGDDSLLAERSPKDHNIAVKQFGSGNSSIVSLKSVESRGFDGITIELILRHSEQEQIIKAEMSAVGKHNATNVMAAVAGVLTLFPDFPLDLLVKGLQSFKAPLMRLNLKEIAGGKKIVDDSYNANPASMRGLVELGIDLKKQGAKIGCVFGEMFELGDFAVQYHQEVGREIVRLGPSFLVGVGSMAKEYVEIAKQAGISAIHAENAEVAAHIVRKIDFDILLVKGSRGVGLDRTVRILEGN